MRVKICIIGKDEEKWPRKERYLDDVQNSDDEDMPDGRVSVLISDENGGLVFESLELDAHLGDHDADCQEI